MASIPWLREAAPPEPSACWTAGLAERLAAAAALAAVSPVIVFSAATLVWLSRRSPLIAHRRVGKRGAVLWMLKLRTMWDDARPNSPTWIEYIDDEAGPLEKGEQDRRVRSRFARFCRRHSIDELPQLIHVVLGEMALVGPRPLTAGELRRYYGGDAREILEVKPGIAGLWQVSGRNRLSYAERRRLDLKLVRERSRAISLRILLRSLGAAWSGADAW